MAKKKLQGAGQGIDQPTDELGNGSSNPFKELDNHDDDSNPNELDIFSQLMSEEVEERSTEEIIKELLASGRAKRFNGLTVKNVVAGDPKEDNELLRTFVVKEFVLGKVYDKTNKDAFGKLTVRLGKTHNVQSSAYAIAGVMKYDARLAIFAEEVISNPTFANILFAGSKIDVIIEYVPKHTDYVNPFSSGQKPTKFDEDKMIHYIVYLELGPAGEDLYRARLLR